MSDQSPEPSLAQSCCHPIRMYLIGKQDQPAAAPPRELEGHALIVGLTRWNVRADEVLPVTPGCGNLSLVRSVWNDCDRLRNTQPKLLVPCDTAP